MNSDESVSYRDSALQDIISQYVARMQCMIGNDDIKTLTFSEHDSELSSRVESLLVETGFEKRVISINKTYDVDDYKHKTHIEDLTVYLSKQDGVILILSPTDLQYNDSTPCLYRIEDKDLEGVLESIADADKKAPTMMGGIVASALAGTFIGGIYGLFCGLMAVAGMHLLGAPADYVPHVLFGATGVGGISASIGLYPTVRTGRRFLTDSVVSKGEQALYDAMKHAPIRYRVAKQTIEPNFHEEEVLADPQSLNTNSTLL